MTTIATTAPAVGPPDMIVRAPMPRPAVLGPVIVVGRVSPHDIREHMIHSHHRAPVELLGEARLISAVHRFEHFEAGIGLVDVDHGH
jgi:hypothetical protein